MTAKHTPGPWRNGCDPNDQPIVFQRRDLPYCGEDRNEEWQANLALLDAAPDLLALAHQYARECGDCHGTGLASATGTAKCEACADIWAVIDRAEGRA